MSGRPIPVVLGMLFLPVLRHVKTAPCARASTSTGALPVRHCSSLTGSPETVTPCSNDICHSRSSRRCNPPTERLSHAGLLIARCASPVPHPLEHFPLSRRRVLTTATLMTTICIVMLAGLRVPRRRPVLRSSCRSIRTLSHRRALDRYIKLSAYNGRTRTHRLLVHAEAEVPQAPWSAPAFRTPEVGRRWSPERSPYAGSKGSRVPSSRGRTSPSA